MIQLTEERYNELVEAAEKRLASEKSISEYRRAYIELQALEAFGVDNWEGYSLAMSSIYSDDEEEE